VEFAGHGVDAVFDDGEAGRADVEVGAFGRPAAQQAAGLLVGGAPPGEPGLAVVHLDSRQFLDVRPSAHLCALVPCEVAEHGCGLAAERGGDGSGGASGVLAAGKRHQQGVAAGALDQGGHRVLLLLPMIKLPSQRPGSSRSAADWGRSAMGL